MIWDFTFVYKVRKDGKNKEIGGNSSLFVLVFIQKYLLNSSCAQDGGWKHE